MKSQIQEIESVLRLYFDGLYRCDTEILMDVFHTRASYVCATENQFIYKTMDEYFAVVGARESPLSRNEMRRDEIVSIEIAGSNTAFAKVHCSIGERYFTDFLTLVMTSNEWRIISKVFHYDIMPAEWCGA